MLFQVTQIDFDLSTDDDTISEQETDRLQQELHEEICTTIWEADDEDDLIEEITCVTGWCIKSIDYVHILR